MTKHDNRTNNLLTTSDNINNSNDPTTTTTRIIEDENNQERDKIRNEKKNENKHLKFIFTYQRQRIVIYDFEIRSLIFWLFITFLYLFILGIVYYRHQVPNLINNLQIKKSEFSSKRVLEQAKEFYTNDNDRNSLFGRVVGSEEYRSSLNYLNNLLLKLKKENDIYNPNIEMLIDLHYVKDGEIIFNEILFGQPITLSYSNVTNIIVKIQNKNKKQFNNETILISSHFDSVPSTPSVSGTIPTFISLEFINNLIHDQLIMKQLNHPIIFIFNSAKEIGLIGSKIFMSKHLWSKTIKVIINMESIGTGAGRDLTFQSSNTWMMKQFVNVCKYPKGNVIAQDFFRLGLIPSQSDFNVYLNNNNLNGMDVVFYRNGYVHQNHLDTFDKLNDNSLQHLGENILPLIKKLIIFNESFPNLKNTKNNLEEFEDITTNPIYFDLLSFKMFIYSSNTATSLNYVIILISLTFMIRKIYQKEKERIKENLDEENNAWDLLIAFTIVLSCLIASCLCSSLVAIILSIIFKKPMAWYAAGPLYTLFLFGFPSLFGMSFILKLTSLYTNSFYMYVAIWLFWVIVTLIFTFFNIASGYLSAIFVIALILASSHTIQKITKSWMIHLLIMMSFPLIFSFDMILIAMDIFVPIMSRSGFVNQVWACDVIIACLIGLIAFFGTNLLYPYIVAENQRKKQITDGNKISVTVFLIVSILLLIISGMYLFPYSEEAPKRVIVQKVISLTGESTTSSYLSLLHTDSVPITYVLPESEKIKFKETNSIKNPVYLIPALAIQQVTNVNYNYFLVKEEEEEENSYFIENQLKIFTLGNKKNITIILDSDNFVLSQEIRIYSKDLILNSSISNLQDMGDYYSFFHLYASSSGDYSKVFHFNLILNESRLVDVCQIQLQIISHYIQSENSDFLFKKEIFNHLNLPSYFTPIYTIVTVTNKTLNICERGFRLDV
ncbi:hypothetical protein ABK040_001819 [Willaertia magna]